MLGFLYFFEACFHTLSTSLVRKKGDTHQDLQNLC